jgi:hypothetical protein
VTISEQGVHQVSDYSVHRFRSKQFLTPLGWEHINLTGDYVWRSHFIISGLYGSRKKIGVQFFPFSEMTPIPKRLITISLFTTANKSFASDLAIIQIVSDTLYVRPNTTSHRWAVK